MRDIGHLGPSRVKVYLTALGTTLFMTLQCRGQGTNTTAQGWGLLSQFPPFRYFPIFSSLSSHTLALNYHVYI